MENLSLKLSKIVGTQGQKIWSQVYTFTPQEEEKLKKRGTLVAVFSYVLEEETETASIGREILQRMQEEYFGEEETPILKRLTLAVRKIAGEFPGLEITAAVQVKNLLYLALSRGEVWLKRDELLGRIIKSDKVIVNGSGFLKTGDLLILGTNSFFELISPGVLRGALESSDPQEAVEALTPLVHGQETASGVSAIIGKIEKVEPEFQEVVEEIVEARELPVKDFSSQQDQGTSLVSRVKGKIPRFSLGAVLRRRNSQEVKNRKMFFLVAVILIALLGISLFFGAKKRTDSETLQKYNQTYQEASQLLEQGQALITLNPVQARDLLSQAKEKVNILQALKIEKSKTDDLQNGVETAMSKVFKEYQLTDVPVFLDLTLVSPDVKGDQLALSGTYLAILDQQNKRVLGADLGSKSTEILAGGSNLSDTKLITSDSNSVLVLEKDGVAQVQIKGKNVQKGKVKTDSGWGEIKSLKEFGGNLYLLDTGRDEIWRYSATESGFSSSGQAWFKEPNSNLTKAIAMSIDGSIWVLTSDGKILKYTQGAPVGFTISGLVKPFSNPSVLYTDDSINNLYVSDKGNQRIVVLDKSGAYQAEYAWSGIADVSDMVVSESGKKILLLSGSKVYGIDLR
ncbi:MAG: hypothetical protein Q8Q24_01875 [bacterium]|nr:hypothetical protein [bacterium]